MSVFLHFFLRKKALLHLFTALFLCSIPVLGQQKIALHREMFFNFSTKGDVGKWVDEQSLAGDPATGNGGQPSTVFSLGWEDREVYYPAMIVLDLGRLYNLSSLWLFDVNDSDSLFVYTGNPGGWQLKGSLLLNTFNSWRVVTLNTPSRFLMFRLRSPSTRVAEIVLYGSPAGTAPAPPAPQPMARPLMRDFMGVNGFVDDPLNKIACVGNLREYHNWGWDEGNHDTTYTGFPSNQYAWNPSWVSGPGWGFYFDDFYGSLRQNNIAVMPDLQGTAPYITGFNDSLEQHKPLSPGENALAPASYAEHADYTFQFAARYGQKTVSPSLLKLRPDQQPLSGLSLIRYLENWNEPDKWWFGRGGYFRADEFAALCSADYDGHNKTLGSNAGMKNADPSIRMVMGGLASLNLEYIRCMKLWSDYNRQGGFPADVLNFHHYSENGSHGISPEEDSLKQKLEAIVSYRNTWLPGKEIWLSEFGYDTHPDSPQAAVAIDTNDIYEVQAQWIMRSYLAAAAAGIDKAFVFMLRDVNAPNPNKYNSSGLTNEIWNGHQPKKSWYYVSAMNRQLADTRFYSIKTSGRADVNVYTFASATADTIVYVVWCPLSENRVISDFQLNIGSVDDVKLVAPVFGSAEGVTTALTVVSGKVSLRVTERPVFIRTMGNKKVKVSGSLRFFNPQASPLPAGADDFRLTLLDHDSLPLCSTIQPQYDNEGWTFSFPPVDADSLAFIKLWESPSTGQPPDAWLWNNWGSISALDALLISYLAAHHPAVEQLGHIPQAGNPTPFVREIADVSNNNALSALDILMLLYRATNQPGMSPFPGGRHNFILGGNFDNQLSDNIYPQSPSVVFQAAGTYAPTTPATQIYYLGPLNEVGGGERFFNIYFAVAGDLNLSAGL